MNLFGGRETDVLQMALRRRDIEYSKDIITKIDDNIKGSNFLNKIKLIRNLKKKLRNMISFETLQITDDIPIPTNTHILLSKMNKLLSTNELKMSPFNDFIKYTYSYLETSQYGGPASTAYYEFRNKVEQELINIFFKLNLIHSTEYDTDIYDNPRVWDFIDSVEQNSFGGKQTDALKMALDKRNIKYNEDSIELIDKHLQIMKIQKTLNTNIQIKKNKKRMLRGLVEEYLSPDYAYEYGTEYPWDISDEETSDLIKDAYLTLNKDDLNEEPWIEFINKVKESIINIQQIINNLNSKQKNIVKSSLIYFELLLKKLKLDNNFGKSKIPDNVVNKKLYSKIKSKINREVKRKKRRWGAYDSGRLVREYKKEGGKYKGKRKGKGKGKQSGSKLDRWYKEKWIDACKWPKKSPCGRSKAKRGITYCRPSVKVNSQTPKTVQEFTKKQIKNKCERKKKNGLKIIRN